MCNSQITIANSKKLKGDYFPPSSKSHTFRALLLSLYSKNSLIKNRLKSDDVDNFVDIIKNIGFIVKEDETYISIEKPDDLNLNISEFDFKNSGTALRFMVSYFSLLKTFESELIINGDNQLKKRKIKKLLDALSMLGLEYQFKTKNEIPFSITKNITPGTTIISGKSSQFLSSLLLTLPFMNDKSYIYIEELNEKPYIDMTLYHLNRIGVKIENDNYKKITVYPKELLNNYEFTVPSDFSSATYIILATILSKGEVDIHNLDLKDTQGDKLILDIITKLGCSYTYNNNILNIFGSVEKGGRFDMNSTPDMLPALVFFLVHYPFYFEFTNLEPIRYKETDRVDALYENLKNMGVNVQVSKSKLSFIGKENLGNSKINGFNDHRIIMGATLLGIKKDQSVSINNIKNIGSSYPDYLLDLEKLGVTVICSS